MVAHGEHPARNIRAPNVNKDFFPLSLSLSLSLCFLLWLFFEDLMNFYFEMIFD